NYEGCREPTSFDPLSRPTVVEGITDAVQLGLGERHTCALHASGDVSCWGSANEGRTGPSPATWPLGPRPVPLPAGVTQIAVGRNHSCALTGGEIWCWGGNHSLELGSGSCGPSGCTPSDSGTPVRVDLSPFSATAVELAAGYEHTCALLSDARVVCWGDGWFGQRGDLAATGPDAPRSPPALVQQLDTSPGAPAGTYFDLQAVAIAAGAHHTCALLPPNPATGANIVCWGNNEDGQLGRGLPAPGAARAYAETIDGTLQANALVAGAGHTCARVGAGLGLDRLYCWGLGSSGQLGQLDTRSRWGAEGSVFDTASNDGGWLPLDAGAFAARGDSSCAVRAIDSRVLCWGANASGQLGDGSLRQSAFPVPVRTIAPGTQLALGDEHLCGRRADGWISCTGRGDAQDALERSLASGANERTALADIASLGRARAVAAGQSHTCALGLDGRIRCAGSNYLGQLGNGSDLDSSAAVLVGGDLAPISDALAIATAWHHGCALRAGGAVSCWGAGESGQLGDGRIRGSADDCGDGSRSAITMAGFLGQIPCSRAPVDVVGLPAPAVQIGVGLGTSCARLGESADGSLPAGSVYCWGAGGTLGDGTQIASATPIRVLGVEGAIDLGVGSMHACAVIASGRIECWGIEAGWLGDGVLSRPETCFAVGMDGPCALTPVRVVGLDEAVQVAAGMTATCALLEGGSVSCWGRNARGEVGDGTRRTRLVPGAPIAGLPRAEELVGGPSAFCALAPEGGASCWGRGPVIGTGGWLDELSPMPLRGF
ncbi:MAG: hypothetical protein OEY14_10915, partial [Myxococcales bacterium]|nr:hypothetical protein [Myxococcales bacterium]